MKGMYDDLFRDWDKTVNSQKTQYQREQASKAAYDSIFEQWQNSHMNNQYQGTHSNRQQQYEQELRVEQQEDFWRRMRFVFIGGMLFWWFMFVFKNAYRAPPGYMLYKDKNTGEIMYVHHKDVDKFEEQERAEGKLVKNTKRDSHYTNTPIYDSPSQRNHSNNLSRSNSQPQGDDTQYNPWAQDRKKR